MTPNQSWIKVRYRLHEVREVIVMSIKLNISPYQVAGHLIAFWSWADAELANGAIYGCMRKDAIDLIVGKSGFTTAMVEVGWLIIDPEKLYIPNWDRYFGAAAKKRARNAKYMGRARRDR